MSNGGGGGRGKASQSGSGGKRHRKQKKSKSNREKANCEHKKTPRRVKKTDLRRGEPTYKRENTKKGIVRREEMCA